MQNEEQCFNKEEQDMVDEVKSSTMDNSEKEQLLKDLDEKQANIEKLQLELQDFAKQMNTKQTGTYVEFLEARLQET